MKSAYELAMERLNKATPTVKLSAAQKKQLAELDSRYKAKIAECELATQAETAQAAAAGDADKMNESQQRLVMERKKLQADLEDKKEAVRRGQA